MRTAVAGARLREPGSPLVPLLLLAGTLALAATAARGADAPPALAPGPVVWKGVINGIDRRLPEARLELSPGGGSFLYYQGLPWPRLMLQPIEPPGAEPRMLGTSAPLAGRAPRFDRDGSAVFFTIDRGWRPRRPRPPGAIDEGRPVRAAVARIRADGTEEQVLAPPSAAGRSAVLLDLHPGGQTLLIGRVDGLSSLDVASGNYTLDVEELTLPGKTSTPLGFQVEGRSPVRYSRDGRAIHYARGSAPGDDPRLYRHERSSGLHRELPSDPGRQRWNAGDLEVQRLLLPHPGSFGRDAYPVHLLHADGGAPSVALRVPEDFSIAAPGGLRPHTVRSERILLSAGTLETLEVVAARWDPAEFEKQLALARSSPHVALDPGDAATRARRSRDRSESVTRATADAAATALIERLSRSLLLLPGAPVSALRARWTRLHEEVGAVASIGLEVLESAAGAVRVERLQPADNPEDAPLRELLVFDGRRCGLTGDDGVTRRLPLDELVMELGSASPYRLLLDPAGVGLPGLHFRLLRDPPAEEADEVALAFRHVDGYHGVLHLRVRDDQVLPARIVSPLHFRAGPLRRGFGSAVREKTLFFADYRPVGGRLIPHRLRFDDGLTVVRLELEELVINPALPEGIFQVGESTR